MSQETIESAVKKEVSKSAVSVDKVYVGEYQKEGTKTAQLRQVVKTDAFYPSKQVSNSHQDNVFSLEEFGFESTKYSNEENRVAWIDIPTAASKDDVLAKLSEDACLYRVLSNRPVITDSQAYGIQDENTDLSMDTIAERQVVRYSDNHEKAGQIVPDANGKPQYRAVFFSSQEKEDLDLRNADAADMYMSQAIQAEMVGAGAIVNQDI